MLISRAVAAALGILVGVASGDVGPPVLKVITLNTKLGGESPWNPSEQIRVIGAERPDIVMLQEVVYLQFDQYRTGIGRAAGGRWSGRYARHCEAGTPPRCDKYGAESVVVLTRFPMEAADTQLIWARDTAWRARAVARIRLRLPGGATVDAFSCHLPFGSETAERSRWVAAFKRSTASLARPEIVAGDFNDEPSSAPIVAMKAGYVDAWTMIGGARVGTESSDDVTYSKRLDYIFSSGALTAESATVLPAKISDHRAVVATFRLNGRP